MKYKIISLFIFLSFNAHSKLNIVTTTSNLADIVRQVGGDNLTVESLCKGVQDPHYLEAKPSYIFKLSKADLLISIGAGLEEGWLPLIIRGSRNPSLKAGGEGSLVASHFVKLLDKDSENISRSQGDVHPDGNPHFMLSPRNSILVAKGITDKLVLLDPKNSKDYIRRLDDFTVKMNNLINTWTKKITLNTKVISYHKTLTYFYNDFSIINVDVLEPKPGVPPTASHILNVISKIKQQGIRKILVENYYDESIAKRIQKEVSQVDIKVVPVAVDGNEQVKDIFELYTFLINATGGTDGSN